MRCISGWSDSFWCDVGKNNVNPVTLGTRTHNHSKAVANLALLEVGNAYSTRGIRDRRDFRQAPGLVRFSIKH